MFIYTKKFTASAFIPTDNTFVPTDDALVRTDDALVRTDDALVPTDDTFVPTDSALVCTDSALICTDGALVPTNTANVRKIYKKHLFFNQNQHNLFYSVVSGGSKYVLRINWLCFVNLYPTSLYI